MLEIAYQLPSGNQTRLDGKSRSIVDFPINTSMMGVSQLAMFDYRMGI